MEYLNELLSAIERFSIVNDMVSKQFMSSSSLSSSKGTPTSLALVDLIVLENFSVLPSVLRTELVSKDARLPQWALQDPCWEPLCEEAVSKVTVVEFSETAIVSVEPIGSPPDLVLAEWDALKKGKEEI